MELLDQYKKSVDTDKGDINRLKLVNGDKLTADNVGVWLDGEEDENMHFINEDEIVEDATNEDEEEEGEEGEAAVQKIPHDAAIAALTTSVTREEENGVNASDVLVLKILQEQVFKKFS